MRELKLDEIWVIALLVVDGCLRFLVGSVWNIVRALIEMLRLDQHPTLRA
jgi:hypothetical protein